MRELVYAWAEPSSRGTTTYEVTLWSDGGLTCNCPGWVFKRAGAERECKHTRLHAGQVPAILAGHKVGTTMVPIQWPPEGPILPEFLPPRPRQARCRPPSYYGVPPGQAKKKKSPVTTPPQLVGGRSISFIDETAD
jgi:hypothetical protein